MAIKMAAPKTQPNIHGANFKPTSRTSCVPSMELETATRPPSTNNLNAPNYQLPLKQTQRRNRPSFRQFQTPRPSPPFTFLARFVPIGSPQFNAWLISRTDKIEGPEQMAKAAFHKNQRVYVKPVGTWAVVEKVMPQWVKGLDEPLKVHYDVGLGREFGSSELAAEKSERDLRDSADFENWRIGRERNRWREAHEVPNHPHPGSFPVVFTDDKDWGGWRVPISEYDRDPDKVEFEAKLIESAPSMMSVCEALAKFGADSSGDLPEDVMLLAKRATTLLRRIYETETRPPQQQAAE